MSLAEKTISHKGTVTGISSEFITVSIMSQSACSACHAKGFCSSLDSKEKTISVPNQGENVLVNDIVNVSISQSLGFKAVFYAFIIPVTLVVLSFFSFQHIIANEGLVGLISLASLVAYYTILYQFKSKLNKNFVFKIEKL